MARSEQPMAPQQNSTKHKTKNTANTAKNDKQTSLDGIDKHTRATTRLRQKAAREECYHAIKMRDYADNHAIKMKEYANKIFNMNMCYDALCQQHGEYHEE